jgi:hypothetical protein
VWLSSKKVIVFLIRCPFLCITSFAALEGRYSASPLAFLVQCTKSPQERLKFARNLKKTKTKTKNPKMPSFLPVGLVVLLLFFYPINPFLCILNCAHIRVVGEKKKHSRPAEGQRKTCTIEGVTRCCPRWPAVSRSLEVGSAQRWQGHGHAERHTRGTRSCTRDGIPPARLQGARGTGHSKGQRSYVSELHLRGHPHTCLQEC